jgi:ketosteroid isomerase-like protein
VDDVDAFLAEVVPRLVAELTALENGDAGPRLALWSHRDPVTLFGAERTGRGREELEPVFGWLASSFTGGRGVHYEVLGAGVSCDLGYVAAIERSVAGGPGRDPAPYALRVTTVFRREDGEWKVVHRHGDPFDDGTRSVLDNRATAPSPRPRT